MGQDLKHLALVVDDTLTAEAAPSAGAWVARIADHFSRLALFCLKELPDLECLSFFYPELQEALREKSTTLLDTAGFSKEMNRAAAAFAELDADLSLLGFPDLLPSRWASLLAPFPPPGPHLRSVHFYLGYSGREEVVRAAEEIITAGASSVTDGDMDHRLLAKDTPDPDLIVFACRDFTPRDFMIWQSSYAEIWHTALPGTDCSVGDMKRALIAYGQRERRFGKV